MDLGHDSHRLTYLSVGVLYAVQMPSVAIFTPLSRPCLLGAPSATHRLVESADHWCYLILVLALRCLFSSLVRQ